MISSRSGRALALAALLSAAVGIGRAHAAADVHHFNLVLSLSPSQVDGGDFNTTIDFINTTRLTPFGLEGMKRVTFAWIYDADLEYFVRPNMAVHVGVGQLRAVSDREYLPQLSAAIQLHAEMLSVPVHVGAAYYLAAYNQGDFQARAYLGAGFLSLVYNKTRFQQEVVGLPGVPNVNTSATADSPGYYVETGARMFFASRTSVLIGLTYRSAKVRHLIDEATGTELRAFNGEPYVLDLSGVGLKVGLGIGF